MKRILLIILTVLLAASKLSAQECNCGSIKFVISQWKCKGKDAAGNPVYTGVLNVGNGPGCTFKLLEIMQQVAGDVSLAMPLTVPPNTVVNVPITFTDKPPFISAGSTAHFILVFTRGTTKCKVEIQSAPFPPCGDVSCKCNPDGWQPFIAQIGKKIQTVKCGFQFSLTCADTVTLKGGYKCLGDCKTKFVAVLKNATTGVVVQNYASFSFPWSYRFTTPGNYSLEIVPVCGDTKCQPCRFFFTVGNCETACDCNPNGWSPFELSTPAGVKQLKCGERVQVKKGAPAKLTGKYTCKGHCEAKYSAVLINNTTGAVVQNYPAFTFPFNYNFPAAGTYRLEITPVCGNKKCPPCTIFFIVQ